MSINNNDLTQPERGTLFIADENTPLPTTIGDFTVAAQTVGEWKNLGHMSNDTKPSFATSGGQPTNLDTWLQANVATSYSATTGTITVSSVQGDPETLKLIYNGVDFKGGVAFGLEKQAQRKALFLMWQDSRGGRMGVYMPSVDLTYDSLPRLTGNGFVEFGISGSILTSTALPVNAAGKPCAVALISPESFGAIVPVTGVTVTPATLSLAVGGNQTLTAAVVPSTASQNVMWSSSNPSIATVDESGNVTAVAAGTANIIASSATSMSAQGECRLTVTSA